MTHPEPQPIREEHTMTTAPETATDTTTTEPTPRRILPPPPEPTPPRRGLLSRVRHSADTAPLTNAEAAYLATRVSDDPVPLLDESAAPCQACGVAVPLTPGTPTEWRDLPTATGRIWRQPFARCPDCSERHDRATALVAALPALSARYGGVVGDRVESALVVLAVLDRPLPDPATTTRADAERLLRFLAVPGVGVSWMTRAVSAPGHAAPYPFAHVRETDRTGLRSAYANLLGDRLSVSAEPVALTPPPIPAPSPTSHTTPVPGGCLMCGLSVVAVPALVVARAGGREIASRQAWTLHMVPTETLGGRRSPIPLAGHLCPDCDAAAVYVGALGPSALERSLTHFLGLGGTWMEGADALTGLVGWGALVADAHRRTTEPPAPNPTRWAHVSNLDMIARDLSRRS